MVGCSVLHFRDSPYCHDHSSRDLESVKQQVGGTSELEDEINRAVEKKLDHAEVKIKLATRLPACLPTFLPSAISNWGGCADFSVPWCLSFALLSTAFV
jgi:hypothetical protein